MRKPITVEQSSDKTDPEDTGAQKDTCAEPNQTESQTSTRPKTVIDYRKFLEDYIDEPPSPLKKKKAVDLKRKPSKTRIAASKYSRSKQRSKLPRIPGSIRKGNRSNPPTTTLATDDEVTTATPQVTSTIPATSQETQEAIEALLLLGKPPEQAHLDEDDNANLMPIVGGKKAGVDPVPAVPPLPDENRTTTANPTPEPGTVLGVAIKTDVVKNPTPPTDEPNSNKESGDTPPENQGVKRKMFITKEYGLKKRVKSKRKFKCGVCAMELETVKDYNQHYLDNHPPTPCPYCPRLFSSPRTMAKHKYSHDEIMFECETCGQGFMFKSQYESHRRVHLKIQGFICFKANCGQWFKWESELNTHLKAHTSKPLKCEFCAYQNSDKRNLCAHMRVHSDTLPYICALCGKRFKWQEQKKRHYSKCSGD